MKKKQASLSDKLNKLFAPEDASEDSGDETAPKFSEFDETLDEATRSEAISEFRKRNIKFLEEIDRKYKGTVSSRNEVFDRENSEQEEDHSYESKSEVDDEDDDGWDDEADDETTVGNGKHKSLVLLKKPQSYEDSKEYDDEGSEEPEDTSGDEADEDSEDQGEQSYLSNFDSTNKESNLTLIKEENRKEAIDKGLAVQNQLKIWERMLEMRIKTQPCLIAANSLPPANVYEKLSATSVEFREKSEHLTKTVAESMERLLELQELLLGRYSETKDLLKSGTKRKASSKSTSKDLKMKRVDLEAFEETLSRRSNDMVEYRNNVLMKWFDRTNIASKVRNQKQSLSVLRKIEDSLINRDELVRKTQLYRGGYPLLGRLVKPTDLSSVQPQDNDLETEEQGLQSIHDGEIFDDSDFYHQLLRELIEFKTNTTDSPQEIANKLAELQKLRNKMKKKVDTKASKGRKIRYVVHNKLVNFMAPVPDFDWTDEAKDELYGSLFGQAPAADDR
ncbi:protein Aatf [Anopheles nili]|uniref:protein Aatf n=1 Tax=Anopheles nili TaxID=185578 RepID=UPI00237A4B32|nr:protein Aatf [Anopheles nili]